MELFIQALVFGLPETPQKILISLLIDIVNFKKHLRKGVWYLVKHKILKELSGYEEKLDIRSINPTFYGFYEVFKSSKDLFDMIFEHALYETKMYLHKNIEEYNATASK